MSTARRVTTIVDVLRSRRTVVTAARAAVPVVVDGRAAKAGEAQARGRLAERATAEP